MTMRATKTHSSIVPTEVGFATASSLPGQYVESDDVCQAEAQQDAENRPQVLAHYLPPNLFLIQPVTRAAKNPTPRTSSH